MARERGAQVVECPLDVTDEAAVRAAVQSARDALGPIDILVNNAGVYDCACDFVDSRSEEWKRKMSINILGTLYPTHAILPGMLERGYGRIVNIASVAGVYGIARMADYSMTKGAHHRLHPRAGQGSCAARCYRECRVAGQHRCLRQSLARTLVYGTGGHA